MNSAFALSVGDQQTFDNRISLLTSCNSSSTLFTESLCSICIETKPVLPEKTIFSSHFVSADTKTGVIWMLDLSKFHQNESYKGRAVHCPYNCAWYSPEALRPFALTALMTNWVRINAESAFNI